MFFIKSQVNNSVKYFMAKSWDEIKMLITNILYMNSVAFAFQLDNLKVFHKRVNDTFIKK